MERDDVISDTFVKKKWQFKIEKLKMDNGKGNKVVWNQHWWNYNVTIIYEMKNDNKPNNTISLKKRWQYIKIKDIIVKKVPF